MEAAGATDDGATADAMRSPSSMTLPAPRADCRSRNLGELRLAPRALFGHAARRRGSGAGQDREVLHQRLHAVGQPLLLDCTDLADVLAFAHAADRGRRVFDVLPPMAQAGFRRRLQVAEELGLGLEPRLELLQAEIPHRRTVLEGAEVKRFYVCHGPSPYGLNFTPGAGAAH